MTTLRLAMPCLAVGLLVPVAVAGEPDAARGVTVFAAASLTDVLPKVAAARGKDAPPATFNFDASSRLAKQIEAGAPADLFLSADAEWMDHLEKSGRIEAGTRTDLLGNQLVLVVPARAGFVPGAPSELTSKAIERLALAGETVPAGRYARAALTATGVWPAVKDRVVSGENVRTVLAWVAKGEASAGVVYATDARIEPRVRVAFVFPAGTYPSIVYPAAVVKGAKHADEARRFLAFCRGPAARAVFEAAGFLPPPAPKP
jgi:molybdate transport system substrate-binding protein